VWREDTSFAGNDICYRPMEILYFTLTAIFLYVAADWILNRFERAAGKRFAYRSLIFFAILLVMALTSFTLISNMSG
jgi:predicted PurR-regulated permease PerM